MAKIEIQLDSHQLSAFQSCPRLYFLNYKLNKEAPKDKSAFLKGTAIHAMLYNFYKAKIAKEKFEDCVKAGVQLAQPDLSKCTTNEQLLLQRKFLEYCAYYRNESIRPIGVEVGFSKVFYEDSHYLFSYQGKIDYLAEIEPTRICWVDHKSESRKSDLVGERNQFFGYSWALKYNTGLINYIGLQESYAAKDSFRRSIITYKKSLVDEWYENTLRSFYQIVALGEELKYYEKRRTSCQGKYSDCEFLRVCSETSPVIIKGILEAEYREREPWSPWE